MEMACRGKCERKQTEQGKWRAVAARSQRIAPRATGGLKPFELRHPASGRAAAACCPSKSRPETKAPHLLHDGEGAGDERLGGDYGCQGGNNHHGPQQRGGHALPVCGGSSLGPASCSGRRDGTQWVAARGADGCDVLRCLQGIRMRIDVHCRMAAPETPASQHSQTRHCTIPSLRCHHPPAGDHGRLAQVREQERGVDHHRKRQLHDQGCEQMDSL